MKKRITIVEKRKKGNGILCWQGNPINKKKYICVDLRSRIGCSQKKKKYIYIYIYFSDWFLKKKKIS